MAGGMDKRCATWCFRLACFNFFLFFTSPRKIFSCGYEKVYVHGFWLRCVCNNHRVPRHIHLHTNTFTHNHGPSKYLAIVYVVA